MELYPVINTILLNVAVPIIWGLGGSPGVDSVVELANSGPPHLLGPAGQAGRSVVVEWPPLGRVPVSHFP